MVPEALEGVYRGFELTEMSKCRGIDFVPERSVTLSLSKCRGIDLLHDPNLLSDQKISCFQINNVAPQLLLYRTLMTQILRIVANFYISILRHFGKLYKAH
jgi:hypothetical protein